MSNDSKYDIYYKNLNKFYDFNSPENIANETKNINEEFKKIKDQLFELEGKSASAADDLVDYTTDGNLLWDNYANDALIPATKKIPELKELLDERKKFKSKTTAEFYEYNPEFLNNIKNQSDSKEINEYYVTNYIDEKIDKKIYEIQKLARVTRVGYVDPQPSRPFDPVLQPEYGVIEPVQPLIYGPPLVQPEYGVIEPVQPVLYGPPIIQPEYGVPSRPFEPVIQPEYGVK